MSRPRFQPTEEQRHQVRALAGYGLRQAQIASVVGVGSTATLRKHFREELTLGPLEARANVARTLFRLATSGRNPAATMFWLKTRAGWSEQGKVEEKQAPTHVVWEIHEYQPPRSPGEQKQVEEMLQRYQSSSPAEPVRWEGDKGAEEEEDEAEGTARPGRSRLGNRDGPW
jgi:hypothetical protein